MAPPESVKREIRVLKLREVGAPVTTSPLRTFQPQTIGTARKGSELSLSHAVRALMLHDAKRGVFLIEGCKAGEGISLVGRLQGSDAVVSNRLDLRISSVEGMYRLASLRDAADDPDDARGRMSWGKRFGVSTKPPHNHCIYDIIVKQFYQETNYASVPYPYL